MEIVRYALEVIQYCNGYIDYKRRYHIDCNKVKIDGSWEYAPESLFLNSVFSRCPSCTEKELEQTSISDSELEKIISMSG